MGGSRELTTLSKAREPWPGTRVCHWRGVSLSLLCLALTLGLSVGSGSPFCCMEFTGCRDERL